MREIRHGTVRVEGRSRRLWRAWSRSAGARQSRQPFCASSKALIMATLSENGGFPVSGGILLGLGGFFDGIVLHQILQWHHMLTSAGYPADSVENLNINTFLDGIFHGAGA